MLVFEKAMKAVVARNYHNMVRLGAEKNIRSVNTVYTVYTVYTVQILYTVYTTLHGYSNPAFTPPSPPGLLKTGSTSRSSTSPVRCRPGHSGSLYKSHIL